jgi:hypothetical protein
MARMVIPMTDMKSLVKRRDVARRKFQAAVKMVNVGIDTHLALGKSGPGRQKIYRRMRTILDDSARRFILTVEGLKDLEDQIALFTDASFLPVPALVAGYQSGMNTVTELVSKLEKEKTLKARGTALAKKLPRKEKKEKIIIACAIECIKQKHIKPKSINALASYILWDVTKECQRENIKPPSKTAIWQCLAANLQTFNISEQNYHNSELK